MVGLLESDRAARCCRCHIREASHLWSCGDAESLPLPRQRFSSSLLITTARLPAQTPFAHDARQGL